MVATTKKKSLKDFIPLIVVVIIFGLVTYPQIVRSYFPQWTPELEAKVIEKEKVVEKIVKQTPTVSVDTLKLSLIRIIDADTFVADVYLPLSITLEDQHIRCLDYDGVELNDVKGLAAKNELESLLTDSDIFIMVGEQKNERDSFGRILGRAYCRKQDKIIPVSEWMKSKGYSKP